MRGKQRAEQVQVARLEQRHRGREESSRENERHDERDEVAGPPVVAARVGPDAADEEIVRGST
jgi:hypothetical protein